MSIKAMQAVFDHSESTGSARLVLLAIADAVDHDGRGCWRGKERLASMAHVSRSTCTEAIKRLEELGELVVERRQGFTSLYRIVLPGLGGSAENQPTGDPAWVDPRKGQGPAPTPAGGSADAGGTGGRDPSTPTEEPTPGADAPFGGDPMMAEADRITKAFWEASDPKPMTPFVAIRKIVRGALAAKWAPREVRAALDDCDTISGWKLEDRLKRRRRSSGGASGMDLGDLG